MSWPHGAQASAAAAVKVAAVKVAAVKVAAVKVAVRSHQDFLPKTLACEARVLCCVAGVSLS
jgi:hypothetical protein